MYGPVQYKTAIKYRPMRIYTRGLAVDSFPNNSSYLAVMTDAVTVTSADATQVIELAKLATSFPY
jgi:hypothetical protein